MLISKTNLQSIAKNLAEYVVVVIMVTICLLAGRWLHQAFSILPPSLYGMLLFAGLLTIGNHTGWLPEKIFQAPMAVILRFMSFVFLPASIGVMQYGDLILASGAEILLVGLTATFFMMALVGYLSKKWLVSQHHD